MRGKPVVFDDFSGGVDLAAAPYKVALTKARDCLNVVTTDIGSIKKRNGFSSLAATAAALTSLFALNTSTKWLIGATGTQLYKISTGGTVTSIKTGLTTGLPWEFVMAPISGGQGPLYGMNGTDTPQQWDAAAGSTSNWTASAGAVPNGKYMVFAGNRIWVAGEAANPSRVYWSSLAATGAPDPRNWDTTAPSDSGSVDLSPNDGEAITGIGTVGPNLIVFKPRKAFLITDLNEGGNRQISASIGCISHRSIVPSQYGTFFLSEDQGVMLTDGNQFQKISVPVQSTLDSVARSAIQNAAAILHNTNYYLSVQVGSANDTTLHYDLRNRSWWLHGRGVNQWAILDPTSNPILFAADAGSAAVHKAFLSGVTQDAGTDFSWEWTGPWLTYGEPHLVKRVREIRADGTGSFTLQVARSFSSSPDNLDETVWESMGASGLFGPSDPDLYGGAGTFGATPGVTERRYYTPGVGRAWSLKFSGTDALPSEIYSYMTAIDLRKD